MNKRGQATLPEYVLLLMIVVAFVTAITIYVQRGLQARILDGRNYAVDQARRECNGNCLAATGGGMSREYEPYYGHIISKTDRGMEDLSTIEGGVDEKEGVYKKYTDIRTTVNTESRQRPPRDAN